MDIDTRGRLGQGQGCSGRYLDGRSGEGRQRREGVLDSLTGDQGLGTPGDRGGQAVLAEVGPKPTLKP
jgi:hypothetical protein